MANYAELDKPTEVFAETYISDGGDAPENAFDQRHATTYSSDNTECYIGMDFGEGNLVKIDRVRYIPTTEWILAVSYIKGAIFEASVDGSTYTELHEVDQTVHVGWNSFLVEDTTYYRYVRMRHGEDSQCKLAEL